MTTSNCIVDQTLQNENILTDEQIILSISSMISKDTNVKRQNKSLVSLTDLITNFENDASTPDIHIQFLPILDEKFKKQNTSNKIVQKQLRKGIEKKTQSEPLKTIELCVDVKSESKCHQPKDAIIKKRTRQRSFSFGSFDRKKQCNGGFQDQITESDSESQKNQETQNIFGISSSAIGNQSTNHESIDSQFNALQEHYTNPKDISRDFVTDKIRPASDALQHYKTQKCFLEKTKNMIENISENSYNLQASEQKYVLDQLILIDETNARNVKLMKLVKDMKKNVLTNKMKQKAMIRNLTKYIEDHQMEKVNENSIQQNRNATFADMIIDSTMREKENRLNDLRILQKQISIKANRKAQEIKKISTV